MPTVFTIGYQGRSVDALCETLVEAGVEQLVDVRERAWSNRPEYRKTALAEVLAEHGIDYVHCKAAGNPHRPRQGEARDWSTCRKLYQKHLRENPTVISTVADLVMEKATALFCYEAEQSSCHRGELVEAMKTAKTRLKVVKL